MNAKGDKEENEMDVISTSPRHPSAKTEKPSINVSIPNVAEDQNLSNNKKDHHEFVNPMVSADRNDFILSMISNENGSDKNSTLNSPPPFEREVELVEVNRQRRSTLENIVDTVALEV